MAANQRDEKMDSYPSSGTAPVFSIEDLRELAAQHHIQLKPEEEQDYLALVQGAQEAVDIVDGMPDYEEPRLLPVSAGERAYTQPPPAENPLNAWMYKTHLQHPSTEAQQAGLLAGKTVTLKDVVSVAGVPRTCGTHPYLLSADAPYPVPTLDAPVVARVLEAGATVRGTSTCENYCMSGMSCTSATGPVENPWRRGRSAGGSSSGAAALVAVNVVKRWRAARGLPVEDLGEGVDLAIGGDSGGSARVPAAYCGIYGLKPTHGLVPYTGIAEMLPMVDHCCPMASSLRDTAVLLSAIAGYDGFDPRMTPETPLRAAVPQYHELLDADVAARAAAGTWTPTARPGPAAGLRVAVLAEAFRLGPYGASAEVEGVVRAAAARFGALGAAVREVSVPAHATAPYLFAAAARGPMVDCSVFQAAPTTTTLAYPLPGPAPAPLGQGWYEALTRSNPFVPGSVLCGLALQQQDRVGEERGAQGGAQGGAPRGGGPERRRSKALRLLHGLRAAYDAALAEVDVLLLPATPTAAPLHAAPGLGVRATVDFLPANTANTIPFNLTGHPSLAMPVGWASAPGEEEQAGLKLPVGMQLVAKRWDERTLFLAAAAWEVGGHGLDSE
ncbi:amidase signature enzyme [Xylariaceae sp. FL0804]|nr:amidase signature enzyme [Xylariaceae sp. FL0804]